MLEYSFDKPIPVASLQSLLSQTSWAARRTDVEVAAIVANASVQIGVWDDDRLVAYARAISDGRFRALIDDVVVDQAARGSGIGTELMKRLIARLGAVEEVFLLTGDENVSYYTRLGFVPSSARCLVLKRSVE